MKASRRVGFARGARLLAGRLALAALLAPSGAYADTAPAKEPDRELRDVEMLEPRVDTSPDSPAARVPDADALVAADTRRDRSSDRVMDRMELGRTEITGNQELPKVMVIVPWQKGDPGDLMGRPVNTLLDEVLSPIDREEFVRAVEYYGEIYGPDDESD